MAPTESNVSAMCCSLFEEDGERREGENVITATAFEDRSFPFSDLIEESISHSCNDIRSMKKISICSRFTTR